MLKTSLIAAGLAGLVFAAQPALARATDASADVEVVVRQRTVTFADLDLATLEGQSKFDARLRRAASTVCEATPGPHPLSETMEARRCYERALESARRDLADRGVRVNSIAVAAR